MSVSNLMEALRLLAIGQVVINIFFVGLHLAKGLRSLRLIGITIVSLSPALLLSSGQVHPLILFLWFFASSANLKFLVSLVRGEQIASGRGGPSGGRDQ